MGAQGGREALGRGGERFAENADGLADPANGLGDVGTAALCDVRWQHVGTYEEVDSGAFGGDEPRPTGCGQVWRAADARDFG